MLQSEQARSPPKVTFTISSSSQDDHEDLDTEEMQENSPENEENPRYWLNVANPLLQIRRLSDQGLRNARNQIRRFSNSSSKLIRNTKLHRLFSDPDDRYFHIGQSTGEMEKVRIVLS